MGHATANDVQRIGNAGRCDLHYKSASICRFDHVVELGAHSKRRANAAWLGDRKALAELVYRLEALHADSLYRGGVHSCRCSVI